MCLSCWCHASCASHRIASSIPCLLAWHTYIAERMHDADADNHISTHSVVEPPAGPSSAAARQHATATASEEPRPPSHFQGLRHRLNGRCRARVGCSQGTCVRACVRASVLACACVRQCLRVREHALRHSFDFGVVGLLVVVWQQHQ